MQFTIHSIFFVLLAVLSSTLALPMLLSRDVYDPKITFPKAGSKFTAGETITVVWDTSILPAGTPNQGQIVYGRLTSNSENLNLTNPLAENFLLTKGSQVITFPKDLQSGSNYILILFGDSGNRSPEFTIEAA